MNDFFKPYFDSWIELCPSAPKIYELLEDKGEDVVNDHIALRTLDLVGIKLLAAPFEKRGYEIAGNYDFEQKKLNAIHLEHRSDPNEPKVFISELRTSELSSYVQDQMNEVFASIEASAFWDTESLGHAGRNWDVSYGVYQKLYAESEYAGWFYVYGHKANHFTVSVNALKTIQGLKALNQVLEENGYLLNASGGKIKGTEEVGLIQSSTMADSNPVAFDESTYSVPGCYMEFAERFPDRTGKLYQGFVTSSADKIFESTHKL